MSFQLTERQKLAFKVLGGPARHVLLRGGSRSGKTFLTAYAILWRALMAPNSRHAIFRRYAVSAKATIWKTTLPDVLRKAFPGLADQCVTNETEMSLSLPNGSVILVGGLDDKERIDKILGQEYATIYVNEASEIADWATISTVLTRLAQKVEVNVGAKAGNMLRPKFFADCNPTSIRHWTYEVFVAKRRPGKSMPLAKPESFTEFKLNTIDNSGNIDPDYLETLANGEDPRRFLEGDWKAEVDGALFNLKKIEDHRVEEAPELKRVIVAVDPPASVGAKADACGVVVAGIGIDDRFYVIADRTAQGLTPEGWAKVALAAYDEFDADRMIAEVNNGGVMVESVIRNIRPNVSYRAVRASKGKVTRAEPVSALYERGLVSHVGELRELEDQLCSLTPGFDPRSAGHSPDRADALVWAMTELMSRTGSISLGKVIGA